MELGVETLVECTPAYVARDPKLLARLSEASGLHVLTNTGLYGAR
ncbi:MAG: phosphotriesterase, partial [Opitutaceae bacterium]